MKPFRPAWWLRNRHLQTLFPVFFSCAKKLQLHRETFFLPDGDFIHLDWTINHNSKKPILLLLHGLEGSSTSHYIQRIMRKAVENNYIAVCLHFRGCSGETNNKLKSYHAGETKDLDAVMEAFAVRFSSSQSIFTVGFSLGGNVLLKWLAESALTSRVSKAVAVSVPFELAGSAHALHKGFSKFYEWWLIKCLKRSLIKRKNIFLENNFNYDEKKINSFWEFDQYITAKINGFEDVHDYYNKSSSKQYLKNISTQTLIVHAKDDPFLFEKYIPNSYEVSTTVKLEITQYGGHLGFVTGKIPLVPEYWIDNRIFNFIGKEK